MDLSKTQKQILHTAEINEGEISLEQIFEIQSRNKARNDCYVQLLDEELIEWVGPNYSITQKGRKKVGEIVPQM